MDGFENAGRVLASPYKLPDGTRAGIQYGACGMGRALFHLVKLWPRSETYPGGAVSDLDPHDKRYPRRGTYRTIQEARAALDQRFNTQGGESDGTD